MLFQFRDTDPVLLANAGRRLEALVAEADGGPCSVTIGERVALGPQDDGRRLSERAGARGRTACAGAASCACRAGLGMMRSILAARMPAAMLFVPSIGGISHH